MRSSASCQGRMVYCSPSRCLRTPALPHQWCMHEVLSNVTVICKLVSRSEPQPQLHRAFLVTWPPLMGWFRQQACRWDVGDLMVRC